MDEPKSTSQGTSSGEDQDCPLAWTRILSKHPSERKYKYLGEDEGHTPLSIPITIAKPSPIGWDRVIELLLTAVIAYATSVQLYTVIENNKSTSGQSERLLQSADRIDDAADSFATSSSAINKGVGDAVGKLNLQAAQTERLATAAKDANQMAEEAMRPRLEITNLSGYTGTDYINDFGNSDFFITSKTTDFQFIVSNVAPGDAVNIRYAISNAQQVGTQHGERWMEADIKDLVAHGKTFDKEPVIGKIGNLAGHSKTIDPVVIHAKSTFGPRQLNSLDSAEWFYGEMYWDDLHGFVRHWKLVFCFVAQVTNTGGGRHVIHPCNIPQEGTYPDDEVASRRQK